MSLCCKEGEPRPRDGRWAWLVCAVVLVKHIVLFGTLLGGFGVLLPVLSEEFGESKGKTAWVGSIATGLSFGMGLFVVKLTCYFHLRTISIFGSLVCMTSLVLSSFAPNLTVLFFSYGLLFGFGGGFVVTSFALVIRTYFKAKLALALGIGTSGSSLGVMAAGPTIQILLDRFGWRNAFRIMSGAMLFMTILSTTYDPNVEKDSDSIMELTPDDDVSQVKKSKREAFSCSVWTNPRYTVGTVSIFLTFFGLYTPVFHVVGFAKDLNISTAKASQLFIFIGICSTITRVAIGQVITKRWLSPLAAIQLASFTLGTAIVVFTQATSYSHFVVFSVVYGLANGSFVASQGVFFLTAVEPRQVPMAMSFGFTAASIAIFGGPATAGFIADQMGSYIPAFYIVGGSVVLASVLPFSITCYTCRKKGYRADNCNSFESRMELIGTRLANNTQSIIHLNLI